MRTREEQLVGEQEHSSKMCGKAKSRDFIVLNFPPLNCHYLLLGHEWWQTALSLLKSYWEHLKAHCHDASMRHHGRQASAAGGLRIIANCWAKIVVWITFQCLHSQRWKTALCSHILQLWENSEGKFAMETISKMCLSDIKLQKVLCNN